MSDYRPWQKPAPEPTDTPEPAPDEPSKPKPPVDPPQDETFATAPGLAPVEAVKGQPRGHRLSAALLLAVAGFLLFGGLLVTIGINAGINIDLADDGYVDPEAYLFRNIAVGFALLGAAIAVPGFGLLYDQPWAKPAAAIAGVVCLLPPVTPWGVLSLYHLGRTK